MSLGDTSADSPPFRDAVDDDGSSTGAFVLASLRNLVISVSYTVPLAFAILLISVTVVTWLPGGTKDLPPSAAAAGAFWISGWLVQSIAYLIGCWCLRPPASALRLGLFGVEIPAQVRSAGRTALVGFGTVVPVLLLGMFYRLVEGGFRMPQLAPATQATWMPPSVGLKSHESIWLVGAWLCWVQVVLQMIPFPRTPGRVLLGSLVVGVSGPLPPSIQCRLLRQLITLLSIALVAIAIPLIASEDPTWSSKWPLVLVAAMLLWLSSRGRDIVTMIELMQPQSEDGSRRDRGNGLVQLRRSIAQWRTRKRLRNAQRREQGEASDANRLDEILNRLHRDGYDSLSHDDRRILTRVSENLRKQREQEDPSE